MKSKTLIEMQPLLERHWGEKTAQAAEKLAHQRWLQLCQENEADHHAKKVHTLENIFPCISLYEALQAQGVAPEDALSFLDQSWSERARAGAKATGKLLRFCGLYRLYPAMFRWVARHQFGRKAGFSAEFYNCGRTRCKFDMTRCLFLDTCRRYGCPELTVCFCHTDDINNAGLHPRLCWNRTQFMGNGGAYCDFDIFVEKKP